MGEQFLRRQASSFRHRSATEYNKLRVPTLLTQMRPETLSVEYDCVAAEGALPLPGACLLLHGTGDRLVVVDGNCCIGDVDCDDVAPLHDAVNNIGDGLLRVEVRSVSPIGGFFTIRVAENDP